MEKWRKDIGYDEVWDGMFQNIVVDETTQDTVAHVFGTTVEECERVAKLVENAPKMAELLDNILGLFSKKPMPTESELNYYREEIEKLDVKLA